MRQIGFINLINWITDMDKLMKPSRVDLDSNSTGACTKEWKH